MNFKRHMFFLFEPRGNLDKIGPNKFMGGVGCVGKGSGSGWGGDGGGWCFGGIVGGKVHFVWYAFITIKKCKSTNL